MAKVVATETFFHVTKHGRTTVREGQAFNDSDPAVKANPDKFITADEWVEGASRVFNAYTPPPPVEAATAAPGETRTVKKPKAKKATT